MIQVDGGPAMDSIGCRGNGIIIPRTTLVQPIPVIIACGKDVQPPSSCGLHSHDPGGRGVWSNRPFVMRNETDIRARKINCGEPIDGIGNEQWSIGGWGLHIVLIDLIGPRFYLAIRVDSR